jgi:hypothetical protein
MKEIAEFIVTLFNSIRLPFRGLVILLCLGASVLVLVWYEHLTGYFYFTRLERKIALLKELQDIASQGIEIHRELYPIYESVVNELAEYEARRAVVPWLPTVNLGNPVIWGKAISGASIWILFLIIGISSDVQKSGKLTGTTIGVGIVVLMIAALFAWLGTLIPTLLNPWVNYIGFPAIQAAVLYLLGRKKKPPKEGQT